MMKKAQFNFTWLFAIIVGGAILFLAVYGAMQTSDAKRYQKDSEIAKSISILIDPLQAGFSEGSSSRILFRQETRINNICFEGDFGVNKISTSTKSNIGEEWNLPGVETSMSNKYIFSSARNSGEEYYIFSKPFRFPYKVADLIFLTSEKYCFLNAPEEISEEILGMRISNIEINNCTSEDSVRVCFGSGTSCDVNVYASCSYGCDSVYDEGTVEKYGVTMKYVGILMYAAIFSDKGIYDCNVRRLLYRTGMIAEELATKSNLMGARDCNTNLDARLNIWKSSVINATTDNLISLRPIAENLDKEHRSVCRLWD